MNAPSVEALTMVNYLTVACVASSIISTIMAALFASQGQRDKLLACGSVGGISILSAVLFSCLHYEYATRPLSESWPLRLWIFGWFVALWILALAIGFGKPGKRLAGTKEGQGGVA